MKSFLFVVVSLMVFSGTVAREAINGEELPTKTYKKDLEELKEEMARIKEEELALEQNIIELNEDMKNVDDEEDDVSSDVIPLPVDVYEAEEAIDLQDPCLRKYCGAGRECVISDKGTAECRCVSFCDNDIDARRQVCSNYNETWPSDCELYRQRCLCKDEHSLCLKDEYKHMHIDYYGVCQQIPPCTEEEMSDFPRRMREWLFNIMRDLADRQKLTKHYEDLEKVAERQENKRWTYAVVWKWCDLDGHPQDQAVSRHELFPIRAPLLALEHCIAPFLDSCDTNNDHFITLDEWITCLSIQVDEVENLEDLCEKIHDEGNVIEA